MGRKHILVAECEKGLQRILSLTLKSKNFSISTVDDCDAIIDTVIGVSNTNPVSMLLVDSDTPDFSCGRMAEQLCQIDQSIPIVALVRYGDEEKMNIEFRNRCALMISKPVEASDLIDGIHKVFCLHNQ